VSLKYEPKQVVSARKEVLHPGRVVGWLPAEESDYYPNGDDLPPQVLNPKP